MTEREAVKISVVEVSRAFPYAFRTPQSILASLDKYLLYPNGKIPIIEIFLAHKTKKSKYSANYLAPIGGKMLPGESILQTAYRKIHEESTLACSPLIEKEDNRFSIDESFNYDIASNGHNPYEKRKVHFSIVSVINPLIVTSIYPIQEDSKIDGFIGLSVDELDQAFNSGTYIDITTGETFPLQGHITRLKNSPDTNLTERNRNARTKVLNKAIHILKQQELRARNTLYDKLVFLAVTKMGLSEEKLPLIPLKIKEEIDATQIFQRVRDKSNKLEELLIILKNTFGDNFNQFFTEAYSAVLGELYMNHFREQEEKNIDRPIKRKKRRRGIIEFLKRKKENSVDEVLFYEARAIRKKMVNGNFSVDVLHFLPLFINMEQSFKGRTTRLIVELARFMRDLTKKITLEGPYRNLDELKEFFMDQNILLETKLEYSQKLNEQLLTVLAEIFQTDQKSIIDAWTLASRFIPDLAEEAKNANPKMSQFYQFHELRNEITNSSLGQTLLLALGVDLKDNGTDWSIVKFEALRQLTFFLKILFEKPIYENIIKKKPHPVDFGINSFFGPVVDKRVIILNSNGVERKMPITYRRGGLNSDQLIIDEKPVKSLRSVVRKSLEERVDNIADIQSCAIVLPDDIYNHLKPEERIDFINNQADGFVEFLKSNYPSWQIEIMQDKDTFDNYMKAVKKQQISDGGKRTGSKGDLLIRRKIKLKMTDNKTKDSYNYELVFYPFEEFNGVSYQEAEEDRLKGLMGWKEKIEDDPSYLLRRLVYPLRGALGLKSIYELLFPPFLYPELVEQMRISSANVYKHISS
ncbi:MAG: hypothetical protein UR54_C0005G0019 [Candidatus Roizmanbacteria bacterium GW2011_GWA2_34_18]|uniref:Nudix hydrolase domain-containing protein n=1 Tax=Candidatus Roizmanbacteria bacterium GW2011_GWA2_34_18 TaxID=1618477 RepID=A0A0G0E132_9BACT|nr:MAG: hypothetical protein UR54_C0005G0019 [Candidatus Roizmanbacteria bacterium GW2011_GWA2_34_18]